MKIGIVRFPGSNCDEDAFRAVTGVLKEQAVYLWHEETSPAGADAVILPGGFAHGDYLRTGAMAKLSPIMRSIQEFASKGGPVLGICNGFQVLTEAGLLPGALLRNRNREFICEWVYLRVENCETSFTSRYRENEIIRIPMAHGEGRYWIDEPGLAQLETNGQIVFRYCDESGKLTEQANLNGSTASIAGVCNKEKNVVGLMPHPERACETLLGGTDGLKLFQSLQHFFKMGPRLMAKKTLPC